MYHSHHPRRRLFMKVLLSKAIQHHHQEISCPVGLTATSLGIETQTKLSIPFQTRFMDKTCLHSIANHNHPFPNTNMRDGTRTSPFPHVPDQRNPNNMMVLQPHRSFLIVARTSAIPPTNFSLCPILVSIIPNQVNSMTNPATPNPKAGRATNDRLCNLIAVFKN